MVVEVNVWGFRKMEAVGHTSMLVGGDTYISWWPADGKKGMARALENGQLATTAKAVKTLQEDIALEGCDPKEYDLFDFDEGAVRQWWKRFKRENDQWHLTNLNCSTVVYKALCAGNPKLKAVDNGFMIWTPWAIEILVDNLAKPAEQLSVTLQSSMSAVNPLQSVGMGLGDLERMGGGGYRYKSGTICCLF